MKEYQEMDKDINDIVTKIKVFDFDSLVANTQTLLDDLKNKMIENKDSFKYFKKFSKAIKKNLKSLKKKQSLSEEFDQNLKKFFLKQRKNKSKTLNEVFTYLLSGLGIFIICTLLCILWRLNKSQKNIY